MRKTPGTSRFVCECECLSLKVTSADVDRDSFGQLQYVVAREVTPSEVRRDGDICVFI